MNHAGNRDRDARARGVVGGYEIVESFEENAIHAVYGVRHAGLDTPLALTMLPAELADDRERVARVEAAVRAVSDVRHEHVARVVELGRDGDRPHVVEAVLGVPLAHALREGGRLAVREALDVARQVAAALACVHGAGLVHGTVSPRTVWIGDGPRRRALLAGFVGAAAGTTDLRYLAPERLPGGAPDARGDVFALGLVLFEMLEGRPFFAGPEDTVRARLVDESAPFLPRFSRITPSGVPALVARMIRRKAADRPSAEVVREEIARCLERMGDAPSAGVSGKLVVVDEAVLAPAADDTPVADRGRRAKRGGRVGRRRPWHSALTAERALLAAALVALAWLAVRGRGPSSVPLPAEVAMPAEESAPAAPTAAEPAAAPETAPEPAPTEPTTPVPDRPPRIVSRHPRVTETVGVSEGASLEFSVRGDDPDVGDTLSYAWRVDGRKAGSGARLRFVAPPAATTTAHTVEVTVADRAGLRTPPVTWQVAVAPRMSETDVREWLDRLAAAWQRGDVATLRLYGIVADADAEPLARRIRAAKERRVVIANATIGTSGKYAHVAFDRIELDAKGKAVFTEHESHELEKRADGFVALRYPAGTSLAHAPR